MDYNIITRVIRYCTYIVTRHFYTNDIIFRCPRYSKIIILYYAQYNKLMFTHEYNNLTLL